MVCDTLCSRSLDKDKQSDCGNLKDPHNTACRLEVSRSANARSEYALIHAQTDYIPDSVALEAFLVEHDECRQERMRQNALPVYSDVLHNHELLPHDEL